MKKKIITAGFLAASIVMVMFVSIAAAAPTISTITISGPGIVWQFNPDLQYGEVMEAKAYYYLKSLPTVPNELTPIKTIIKDNLVTLIFAQSDTGSLTGLVDTTSVVVTASGGEYTISAGPGFAWGRTR